MKPPLQIVTAAAGVIAALLRQAVVGTFWREEDQATILPPITPKLVEQAAFAGGTDAEIADRFLITESELREQFGPVIQRARAQHRINLRVLQYELAKKLNSPMLIWLGKNYLGQSNNPARPGEKEPEFEAQDA